MKLNIKKLNIKKIAKIMCIVILLLLILVPIGNVYGQINPKNDESQTANAFKNFIGWMLGFATGPLTSSIALLVNAVIGAVFALLYLVFSPISAGFGFPFPDQIIFNKIAFFDPNFINPPTYGSTSELIMTSPVAILQKLIQDLYYTGFIIAGAVFVVAAMIIGLKLAISTIASDKAHYKQALTTWIVAIFLLFTTHFIMLGIFTINEKIVELVSDESEIEFTLELTDMGPVGKLLSVFTSSLSWLTGIELGVYHVKGYGGLLIKFAVSAFLLDLPSSIICGILLGQTCALIIMYIKRMFYSIVLGMIAPLIIAVDVIKKTI